ncbi:MAG: hypothetical protein WAQ27_00870 [Candidatus Microsaccharimonas sp.]
MEARVDDERIVTPKRVPPEELWLHNPRNDGFIPTPLDERGLVDKKKLISAVLATVDSSYDWRSRFADVHHLQWPDRFYSSEVKPGDEDAVPRLFRNLAINKVILPRIFHDRLHYVTEPPPVPDDEVMRYCIDAQRVAISLFRQVSQSKKTVRGRGQGEEELQELLIQQFDTFATKFEEGKAIPQPFQLIDFDNQPLETVQDMVKIGNKLGKYAIIHSAVNKIQRPIAA